MDDTQMEMACKPQPGRDGGGSCPRNSDPFVKPVILGFKLLVIVARMGLHDRHPGGRHC